MRRALCLASSLALAMALVLPLAAGAPSAAAQEPGPPSFQVGLDFDGIGGDRWPAGVDVTVTADDPVTVDNPDITLSLTVDAQGDFFGFEVLPGVGPGWFVTVTDGLTTKTHTVRSVSITEVDPATEIVRGTADPFSKVWCNLADVGDAAGYFVEPNANGEWLVDFSGGYDITPGSQVNVLNIDEDWDSTFVFRVVPRPEAWQHNAVTGHDYLYVGDGLSWAEAEAYAVSLGGHLVTINDAVENDWLVATLGTMYWIGMNDIAVEGEWVWSSGEPVTFTAWLDGEPNDWVTAEQPVGEDAAQLENRPPVGWNDVPIAGSQPFVVEVVPTLDQLLDAMVANGQLPNEGLATSIKNQAEKAPLKALANHLSDLVRRGLITQLTMDQILGAVTG